MEKRTNQPSEEFFTEMVNKLISEPEETTYTVFIGITESELKLLSQNGKIQASDFRPVNVGLLGFCTDPSEFAQLKYQAFDYAAQDAYFFSAFEKMHDGLTSLHPEGIINTKLLDDYLLLLDAYLSGRRIRDGVSYWLVLEKLRDIKGTSTRLDTHAEYIEQLLHVSREVFLQKRGAVLYGKSQKKILHGAEYREDGIAVRNMVNGISIKYVTGIELLD